MYRVVAQDNAAVMLETQAVCMGTFGEDTFYCLDGKAWRMTKGAMQNIVYRSDDDLESQAIFQLCREANFPGNRPCTGCDDHFAIDAKIGPHRRGYCSDVCETTTD